MERMQNYEDSWAGSREEIMKIVLAANILSDKCQHCFKLDARIHCKSCLVKKDVCLQCDKIIHEINPFHNRRAWMNGSFVDLAPTQCPTEDNDIVLVGKHKEEFTKCRPFCLTCWISHKHAGRYAS